MSDAKACPFCKSKKLSFEWTMSVSDIPFEGYIECGGCEAVGPTVTATDEESGDCEARAIAAWNDRHVPEGYALVPVKPTGEMIAYGAEALKWQDYDSDAESCYRAMIEHG